MDSELVVVCAVQVAVLAVVVAAIVVYLLRHLMFRRRHDVAGKTVLITGCDSGLGWDVARHCDRLGLRVLAGCAHPAGEGAVRLQAEASPRLHILPLDVADAQSLQAAAKTIRNQMLASEKGLYALINAASHCVCGELQWQTWQHCQKQFDVNFLGVVQTVRTFLPLLKSAKGRIVNVGSLAGQQSYPEPGLSLYSSTKNAVEGLTQSLRFELARHDVQVTLVQPDVTIFEKYLLERHHRNMNEMWDQMSPELRLANQEIFIAYHDRVAQKLDMDDDADSTSAASGAAGSKDGRDAEASASLPPHLRHCFDEALLSKSPSQVYVAVPCFATRFRNGLLALLPAGFRQYIIQRKYKHNIANILRV